jgi:uncharacterized membrane protein YoaK (UPF0700 family)
MSFIIAQIIGLVILLITVVGIQYKTKEKILLSQIIANTLVAIQYFLLDAITGGVIAIINILRTIAFYYYKRKNKKPSVVLLSIIIIIAITAGVLTWQNIYSTIPIIATIIFAFGLWQDNTKKLRICAVSANTIWTIYNISVMAYTGALYEFLQGVSGIISIARHEKGPKGEE